MAVTFRLIVRQVQNVTFPLPVAQYPSRAGEMLSRLPRLGLALPRSVSVLSTRFVSQSKADSAISSTAVTDPYEPVNQSGHGEVSPFAKNPDFHGFSTDPVEDERNMKVGFFLGISVALVIGGTFIHYLPDHGMRKWARREAERLIRLREKDGLPLIQENYYDASKIILPSSNED
uniref:NADH dehydrogenase [ubiquinone] 1 beta subcomplex subunit 11, mitochondrial n=3 Tax=Xiphophorus TaxID=8082 RepID=M4AEF6_XIPMA